MQGLGNVFNKMDYDLFSKAYINETIRLQSLNNSKQIVCNDLKPTAKIIGLMIVCVYYDAGNLHIYRIQFTYLLHQKN